MWKLKVVRLREEQRDGKVRTVGKYQVYHDDVATALSGFTAEPGGPGDNEHQGDDKRLEARTYPLLTHQGEKYLTIGYGDPLPKPAIEVGNTGNRIAILFHPAHGFLSSLGCINAAGALVDVNADIDPADSRARVIAIINDLKLFLGARFPQENGHVIPNAEISFYGEPTCSTSPWPFSS